MNLDPLWQLTIAIVTSSLASSGLWALIAKRGEKRNATTRLLLGIAHSLIVTKGMEYIDRGFITVEEYDDYIFYLCEPYQEFGGDSLSSKIIETVGKLPIQHGSKGDVDGD